MLQRIFRAALATAALLALTMPLAHAQPAPAAKAAAPAKKQASFDASGCFGCHAPIKEFHDAGKHKAVACTSCHTGIEQHLGNPTARPKTIMDPANCGTCHANQFRTMYNMNWEKTARKEKVLATGPSPDPAFDKLMMPHGFTKEHNEPRSHAFALYDQVVVDRAFGGRFQNKEGWKFLGKDGGNFRIWDYLEDQYPGQDHKAFKPGTAAAANPVCMSCKSSDHILDWAYMGDPTPGAKWSRTSKVNEFVKDVNHSLNCNFCHDPHSAKPRVIRDGLIQALTRPEKDTLWHSDPRGAKIDVKDLGVRGYTRKIAMLSRYDTNLQCGQCHVEYNCNPGTDPTTGQSIGMADQRTNHFPFKPVTEIGKHYTDLKFRDFKHGITGALLWKAQHPDVETFYGSKHQKAGVECSQCHMPKVKDPKTGKTFTSHWQTSPKHYVKETCLTCHQAWSEKQAVYAIDSLKNRFQGKVRKAEFWLTRFVDKFEEAKDMGIDPKVLDAARDKHYDAHVNWEWWTASNGSHFHNPDQATESLNKSMSISQEGIKMLDEAMAAKRKAGTTTAAVAPPAAPAAK
ncbi:MAG: ammonia-forming cytochrome c nitrite reductase subunit c552 [Burkholderiaceae bacterium]|jgi:nitrite reductase (cytochrome c-552)|nr:ammonia-forming cytochrome c nitrite reductase subunit c552 [Burkholderiaceae bacterium]MDH5208298.1 ammonia-forming cytochrome c nitrite reductase subunit c552 [Burkholderiaceae bacterium]